MESDRRRGRVRRHGLYDDGGYARPRAVVQHLSIWGFNKEQRPRKLVTHHVGAVYCGDKSRRFLALGNDRAKENAVFGNLFASDDLGKTWTWLERSC